ncbi:L-lactate dehydrogenase (cytochrome) [Ilumatobacter fluminis]|uniref:L-lactate dehydrogenase (Cytochrome) n=1 Tax=Ilumatobacter fluminis TaxID=467091 RepID=A0A4R7I148_9ACTN|nr:alpha-hydroxy acid oxidase [Ilumatobacter fluminis]TDT17191.1 L-lactate dehydrogenase (cytochrome) [Ilumatobacter fluminis]
MNERRIPKPADFAELLRFKSPTLDRTAARLANAHTIADLRAIAKKVTPKAPFDYTDGAAEAELSLARARQAFDDVEFHPAILRDVSEIDTSVEVCGGASSHPFGIAPTGFTRMMHSAGERAGAAAAGAAGIPFSLSTVGTATPEDVIAANPHGRNFFQLYMWKDRDRSMDVLDRAAAAGFDVLLVTVDVPIGGARLRDRYNGLTIPPTLTAGTVLNAIPKVRWWTDFLTTEPLEFSTFKGFDGTVADLLDTMFDPTVDYEDLRWIKDRWPGPVVVKGVQTLADAKRCADLGVDGVLLSNHGGRQLDRAPVPFHLLPTVRRELPDDVEVWIDTGIMSGADVVAAVAQGAAFTLVGRAYLYGLMAGGRRGVDRAIEILTDEITRTMKLLGVSSLAELEPGHVSQLRRLLPIDPR